MDLFHPLSLDPYPRNKLMPQGVLYESLFKPTFVVGLISRYHAPGTTFSNYYGWGLNASNTQRVMGTTGVYDIFDGTRSLANAGAVGSPAQRLNRKPFGQQVITLPRFYDSIGIEDMKIYGTRTPGQNQTGLVDTGGAVYFVKQVAYLQTRMTNAMEFMAARMFSGGFALKPAATGSQALNLCEFADGAAVVQNPSLIPASNLNQAGGIIATSWDNPSADIRSQLMALQKQSARINGRTLRDIWVNGTVGAMLFNNTSIQSVGGIANKIYDTLTMTKTVMPKDQEWPDTGITVIFSGLPEYRFHIYNQGYVVPGTPEDITSQTSASNWLPFIPDNTAIITPPPGDWSQTVVGSERIRFNLNEPSREVIGFDWGKQWSQDPAGTDVKMWMTQAPVIIEPAACYQLVVVF